jgi:hypothetical protein
MANENKNSVAAAVLASESKSDDQKLYEIFELFKDDIKATNSSLYYALLGWKYAHLKELNAQC